MAVLNRRSLQKFRNQYRKGFFPGPDLCMKTTKYPQKSDAAVPLSNYKTDMTNCQGTVPTDSTEQTTKKLGR